MSRYQDLFQAKSTFNTKQGSFTYFRLSRLEELGIAKIDRLPFSIRILLENALRCCDEFQVSKANVEAIAGWSGTMTNPPEIPFKPARVILQDFTGVPAVVDLAAMRAAMARLGGDPKKINPVVPVDLVIDHSVQVDNFGTGNSLDLNVDLEFSRNRERYEFLRWGQKAFENFRIVPPATGIVHQVNLEYLATGVFSRRADGTTYAYPDTLVGTDSHTTMINALGVVGWGVGGIEAEAVMLDQPIYMLLPEVIGFELTGKLPSGATATDLVLTVTSMLRSKGVVGKFVEFYGSGLSQISLADRATIANMAPEYGATMGFFPVDAETIRFLARTGRPDETTELVEAYCKAQHLFRTDATPNPDFTDTLSLDMATVEPSLAGPKRPQDRVSLSNVANSFKSALTAGLDKRGFALNEEQLHKKAPVKADEPYDLEHGSVVIAAITSCTNTSNPSVMLGAGLLAKKAVEKGLEAKPWVKTSLAPGSRVVTNYLEASGTASALDQLGFQTVGYGCTTCIGNSGPLPMNVSKALSTNTDIVAASVLSGNRNFEGRVHPQVKANYLASPPLVVAFALAGRIDIDFNKEPVGTSKDGVAVYLKDIWPTAKEVEEAIEKFVTPTAFRSQYASVFEGDHRWQAIPIPEGQLFQFDSKSTYIQEPPFFGESFGMKPKAIGEIRGARCLALLGDSITTDHISPAGSIKKDSPAGKFLTENGVKPDDFNSYGARRGNDRVMTRGTFANIRIRNLIPVHQQDGTIAALPEGGNTVFQLTNDVMPIYDAAVKYQANKTPTVIFGGTEYGTGSSRDWAAKGTMLLGVKAVIARSFERIHRSNLVGMGILPLQFTSGQDANNLGIDGDEIYNVLGINSDMQPGCTLKVEICDPKTNTVVKTFDVICRIDTPVEIEYYKNGGILQTVLRDFLKS